MNDAPVISMSHVYKRYRMGDSVVDALVDIDLEVPRGDFVSLVGPSGSGKSTLLNMIGCIDVPDSGEIRILGKDTSAMSDGQLTELRLRSLGFIFQSFYLIPTLNALENVELPMKEMGVSRTKRHRRAMDLLTSINVGGRAHHYPGQMSGGEQQRVAIARALANEPDILLADEPTGEVDSKTSNVIVNLLKDLNRDRGVTIIMVTHDLDVGVKAKRMIRLRDGRIESQERMT